MQGRKRNELEVCNNGWGNKGGKTENEVNARDQNTVREALTFLGLLLADTVNCASRAMCVLNNCVDLSGRVSCPRPIHYNFPVSTVCMLPVHC